MTMNLVGQKKIDWDIGIIPIIFEYKQLSFEKYIEKFEKLSLRTIELENENKALKSQLEIMNENYSSLKLQQRLDSLTHHLTEIICTHETDQKNKGNCTANCPDGYIIITGGCETTNAYWYIQVSKKSGNGWFCKGRVDFGATQVSYGKVNAYAYCMKKI